MLECCMRPPGPQRPAKGADLVKEGQRPRLLSHFAPNTLETASSRGTGLWNDRSSTCRHDASLGLSAGPPRRRDGCPAASSLFLPGHAPEQQVRRRQSQQWRAKQCGGPAWSSLAWWPWWPPIWRSSPSRCAAGAQQAAFSEALASPAAYPGLAQPLTANLGPSKPRSVSWRPGKRNHAARGRPCATAFRGASAARLPPAVSSPPCRRTPACPASPAAPTPSCRTGVWWALWSTTAPRAAWAAALARPLTATAPSPSCWRSCGPARPTPWPACATASWRRPAAARLRGRWRSRGCRRPRRRPRHTRSPRACSSAPPCPPSPSPCLAPACWCWAAPAPTPAPQQRSPCGGCLPTAAPAPTLSPSTAQNSPRPPPPRWGPSKALFTQLHLIVQGTARRLASCRCNLLPGA